MLLNPWIYAARPKTLIASIAPIICSIIIIPDITIINMWILLQVKYLRIYIKNNFQQLSFDQKKQVHFDRKKSLFQLLDQ